MEDNFVMDDSRVAEESDSCGFLSDADRHSPISRHICTYDGCDKSFVRLDRLLQHQRVHTGERPYVCTEDNCLKSYTRSSHLKRHIEQSHMKIRTPADVIICQQEGCYKTFVSKDNLKRHVTEIHEKVSKKYLCDFAGCNKSFSKRFQIRAHEYEHKGVEPFQCYIENCKKKFKQRSHLVRHLRSHEGYICDVDGCKQLFEKWSQLRSHKAHQHKSTSKQKLKLGDGEAESVVEKFVCNFKGCSRMYSKLSNLKCHVSICHEGSQVFRCDVKDCGSTFASKRTLGTRRKVPQEEPNEIQLSDICEGIEFINNPSRFLEPLIAKPKDCAPKLFSEEHQMIEKLKRREWRIQKIRSTIGLNV